MLVTRWQTYHSAWYPIGCWCRCQKLTNQHNLLNACAEIRNLPISMIPYWMLVPMSETYQSAWYPIGGWCQCQKLTNQHDTLLEAGADVRNLLISMIPYWRLVPMLETYQPAWYPIGALVPMLETYQSEWYPIAGWCRCQKLTNQHDTLLEAGADVRNFPISIIPYEKANFTPLHWFKMVDL